MSCPFYASSAFDIEKLRDDLTRQAMAIRHILASGQMCPDAMRDFAWKKARLEQLESRDTHPVLPAEALQT